MAGILTPASTGEAPAPAAPRPSTPAPPVTTTSMNNPLASIANTPQPSAPPIHSNPGVNEALMQAFRPIVPDQINSLLGPAIGHIQGQTPPISYFQPRPAAQVAVRRSS